MQSPWFYGTEGKSEEPAPVEFGAGFFPETLISILEWDDRFDRIFFLNIAIVNSRPERNWVKR